MSNYDIVYRLNNIDTTVSVGLFTKYSIPIHIPGASIPQITIIPYTRGGPGENASIFNLMTIPAPRKLPVVHATCPVLCEVHSLIWHQGWTPKIEEAISMKMVGNDTIQNRRVKRGREGEEFSWLSS